MTKYETDYDYPLTDRDVGTFLFLHHAYVEIPARHGSTYGQKKGDWMCIDCGHANKGRNLNLPLLIS